MLINVPSFVCRGQEPVEKLQSLQELEEQFSWVSVAPKVAGGVPPPHEGVPWEHPRGARMQRGLFEEKKLQAGVPVTGRWELGIGGFTWSLVHITELKQLCGGGLTSATLEGRPPRAPGGPSLPNTCLESASVGPRRGVGQGELLESQTGSVTCRHSCRPAARQRGGVPKAWRAAFASSFKKQTAPVT